MLKQMDKEQIHYALEDMVDDFRVKTSAEKGQLILTVLAIGLTLLTDEERESVTKAVLEQMPEAVVSCMKDGLVLKPYGA